MTAATSSAKLGWLMFVFRLVASNGATLWTAAAFQFPHLQQQRGQPPQRFHPCAWKMTKAAMTGSTAAAAAPATVACQPTTRCRVSSALRARNDEDIDGWDDDEEAVSDEKENSNPYQDPNYPDLEFVDYSDPEYQSDRGGGGGADDYLPYDQQPGGSSNSDDGGSGDSTTEARVEAMREERRMKNDEYQFETYYKEILKEGGEFKGEWSVFTTSTFAAADEDGRQRQQRIEPPTAPGGGVGQQRPRPPRLTKVTGSPIKVISRGERIELERGDTQVAIDGDRLQFQRILHHEKVFSDPGDARSDGRTSSPEEEELLSRRKAEEISLVGTQFWPAQLSSHDFRGHQGIMCVGNAYTICTAVPLSSPSSSSSTDESAAAGTSPLQGPFEEYRAELGILSDVLRFRIKVDYSVLDNDKKRDYSDVAAAPPPPPLHLKSLTVCRETLGMWPRADRYRSAIEAVTQDALWGPRGAEGGLYDPPPVGGEEQASQYLLLDLEGRATVLLPYLMDQDPEAHSGTGWVTSLDWTPGKNRFQVDRKTTGGKDLLGLRTLELSEVESASAERYRPRDGGSNMRQ
jgi:hypothetical protein